MFLKFWTIYINEEKIIPMSDSWDFMSLFLTKEEVN